MRARALATHLWIQLSMDVRDKGTLLTFYLVPLVFFFVMGAVFSSIDPLMQATLAASMTIFAVTMGAVMGAPTPIVRMREAGTLRAFKAYGVPSTAVLSVHAISAFVHLFIVSVIIYLVSPLAFHSRIPQDPRLYFAVLAVFLFTSIGIGLLIGVAARGQSFATMLSMAVFLPSQLLSGIMFPADLLPKPLLWLGLVFPATHALQSFYGLAYHVKTDLNANLSLALVAGIGLIAFVLAVWRFNRVRMVEQA